MIPNGAGVAASNQLAPQLTSRCRVFLFPGEPSARLRPEWLAITDSPGTSPIPSWYERSAIAALPTMGFTPVARGGGITIYRLRAGRQT
ncbi:MAG: hypothetical protein JWR24_625 [Actinoallomurus sp.]|nr:hypothetical protein [Actinoallomurus sp.]